MAIVESIEAPGGITSGSAGGRRVRLSSPVTHEAIGEIKVATAIDVRAAILIARAAQKDWEAIGYDARARYMRAALKILLRRQEEFMDVIIRETGRSRVETIMMEMFAACDSLAYYAKNARKILRDRKVPMHLLKTK